MNHPYRPEQSVHFPKTNRESNLDLIGLFHYLAGGLIALFAIAVLLARIAAILGVSRLAPAGTAVSRMSSATGVDLWGVTNFVLFCACLTMVVAGSCMRRRRAHAFCVVVAGFSCLAVPFGTVLGALTLFVLTKPEVRMLFQREAEAARNRPPPAVRPSIAIAGGLSGIALLVGATCGLQGLARRPSATPPRQPPSDDRESRSRSAFFVAPAPLPSSLPLLGVEGVDSDGYPKQYVDRPALRSLLHAHRFKALDEYVDHLQTAFEADPRKEYWPIDAGEAFASAEPELNADLDVWVAASPQSFAAHLARGSHWVDVMWAMRGSKNASETPEGDLRAMREAGARALGDLDEALRLRPRLVAAMRQEMRVAMTTSDDARRDAMRDRAFAACPGCLQPRATYLRTIVPRWGGSVDAMKAFIATLPVSLNPRMHVLAGYVDLDRAEIAAVRDRVDDALAAVDAANKAGDYWEYLTQRAHILSRLKRFDEAFADLNRADAQRPMHPQILEEVAHVEARRGHFLAAGRDLLTTLRIEPSNEDAKTDLPWILQDVEYAASQLELGHHHAAALEAADLAVDLGPLDRAAHGVAARIVLGDATTPERIAELQTAAAAHPGDFRTVQQLDYALSVQGRYPEIVLLWDRYLALHPDDGRAYMERAGTNHHLGKEVADRADAARACELGVSEGCERAGR
jgi:tetratricopeptide (TPR) repeat protein